MNKIFNFLIIILLSNVVLITIFVSLKDIYAWHEHPRFLDPPKGTWTFVGNGHFGTLHIDENNGQVTGQVYGDRITGFWDDVSHKILFTRGGTPGQTDLLNPLAIQIYKGYLFPTAERNSTTGIGYCYVNFAGEFLTPGGGGGSPQMNEFGWTAKKPVLCD